MELHPEETLIRMLVFVVLLQVSQHALGVEVFDDVETVQLPCHVPVNVSSSSTVVWSREDLKISTVHVRQQSRDDLEEQNKRYRSRTSMRPDALQTGDLSLTLRKPVVLDSETYTCTVRRFGQELSQINMQLKVQERPPVWPKIVSPVLVLLFVLAAVIGIVFYCRYKDVKRDPVYKLQLVKATEGQESVQLPCKTKTRLPQNATVEWKRIDTDVVVHMYPNDQQLNTQHETHQHRSKMTADPLKTGDLSLILCNPTRHDRGLYVCTVQKDERKLKQKVVSLNVKEISVPDGFQDICISEEDSLRKNLKGVRQGRSLWII